MIKMEHEERLAKLEEEHEILYKEIISELEQLFKENENTKNNIT